MPPRTSLGAFLLHAKSSLRQRLAEKGSRRASFVIGNESADLDSLTSALLYAYTCSSENRTYIPVVNIPAADLNLRPEFTTVLSHAGVQPKQLTTLDDLPRNETEWRAVIGKGGLSAEWVLVDHNRLQGLLGELFADRVVGVIDHHVDEGSQPPLESDGGNDAEKPYIITTSGSCTSLVTEYVRERWIRHASEASDDSSGEEARWDADVAKLALASILIDTTNLTARDKVTPHDTEAVTFLEAKVAACLQVADSYDRTAFFEQIRAAKQDIGRLSLDDVLRKDYKQWHEGSLLLGVSSVVKPVEWLAHHGSEGEDGSQRLLSAIENFAASRKLDVFVLMTAFVADDEFQRQLVILGRSEPGKAAAAKFEEMAQDELSLESLDWPIQDGDRKTFQQFWRQRKTEHSRKQLAPLMRKAMQRSTRS